MHYDLTLPLDKGIAQTLRAGDAVTLTGQMYTARDAAHKRLIAHLDAGEPLPFALDGETIYYVGPAPARPGHAIGPAGPTTSYRMDAYTPRLIEQGLRLMIGKGVRSQMVIDSMVEHGAVYLGAVGGAAAYIAQCVKSCDVVAYPDLGTEAIHRLEVDGFPAIVLIDSQGNSLYTTGPAQYRREICN